jgi:NAD(P)-dependent dehydrogenase (short-subunit alcohol dehydrogenase family)
MTPAGNAIVITGGTGALGRAVTQEFSRAGGRLAIPTHGVPGKVPGAEFVQQCDLADESQARTFFDDAERVLGRIDVLICLAGGYSGGKLVEETTMLDVEESLRLNLLTVHNAVRCVLPGMKLRRKGRIVTMAAMPALAPTAKRAAYSIAKRAVATLTEVVAKEVLGSGVTCNAIAPSIIRTEENMTSMPEADHALWVSPDEIASLMLFLSSADAGSINGNVIKIYGGVA